MKKLLLLLMAIFHCALFYAQKGSAFLTPVALSSFQVKTVDKVILLKWSLEESTDWKSFDIERSEDGIHFKKVGSKLAISKSNLADYDFVDATPGKNTLLRYRLKLIPKEGSASYSEFREVKVEEAQIVVRLKQNPVRSNIELEIIGETAKQAAVTVVSQAGHQVSSQTYRLTAGANKLLIPAQAMGQGMYQLLVEAGQDRKVISFIKE